MHDVIPQNYDELYRDYGNLIYKILLRHNKIEQNFEDLHSYIWMKLLEAELLVKFERHIQKQHPKVISALGACDLLGISWVQWVQAMSAYHQGLPHYSKGRIICFKLGHWMPTPINLTEFDNTETSGYLQQKALYSFKDILYLADLEDSFGRIGQEVKEGVVLAPSRPEGKIKIPSVKVTKAQFKNYLTMAVLNHYANFCRSKFRRHKERPVTQASYGEDDTPQIWEATLPDFQTADSELQVTLTEACTLLSNTLHECVSRTELKESVEFYEEQVFSHLGSGASIMQALKQANLPQKVQKSVLNAVRPRSVHYS